MKPATTLRDVRKPGLSKILRPATDVWAFSSISAGLRTLCEGTDGACTTYDSLTSLTFETDAKSRILESPAGRFPCFADLRMTIEPSPQAKQK